MLTLAAGDTIAAVADAGSVVTLTMVGGMQLNGGTEAYSTLYQGQLAASAATIYTAPSSTQGFVRSITVVNTSTTTAHSFQLFKGGTGAGNQITPTITLPAGGMATYEDGYGWNTSLSIPAGTTLTNDIHPGYSEYQAIANPSAPASGALREFARSISGRMLLKFMPPSGVDNPLQPALFGNNVILWTPYTSTTVTPNGFGTLWAKGGGSGTVSTLTPATTAPAIISQMRRTRHANVVTTTNQGMGIISTAAGSSQFWRGNSAGLGGFFFFARFNIGLWASNSDRLFVGLTAGTAEVVTSDTVAVNSCGFWHAGTDGANVLSFVTKDASTVNSTSVPGATLAAMQGFDAYIYAKPNDSTIYFRIDDINGGTTLIDSSTSTNLPVSTAFLGPQVEMSNGGTDITANTVAIDVNRIYVESDH